MTPELKVRLVSTHWPRGAGASPAGRAVAGLLTGVEPIGNYAVRLLFDDLHSSGIYVWDYFLKLGRERERIWTDYLAELSEKGLTRFS